MAVSNKDVEVLSEALFCYYFAIYKKGKQREYNFEIWKNVESVTELNKFVSKFGIASMTKLVTSDPAFRSRVGKVYEFLTNRKNFWANALESQMSAFFGSGAIKLSGEYIVMRADMIPKEYDPYKAYETLSVKVRGKLGFRGTIDKDKWNPSDVWIFNAKSIAFLKKFIALFNSQLLKQPSYNVKMMEKLNNRIYLLFKQGHLFPVSLKAPTGGAKVVFENDKMSDLQKVVRYDRLEYTNGNQDAKIKFRVDEVDKASGKVVRKDYIRGQIKTKTVMSGGARLEIEAGGAARYGSMGTENYQYLIRETDRSGIKTLNDIRDVQEFREQKQKYWGKAKSAQWLGRAEYVKHFKQDPEGFQAMIEPYTQALFQKVNKQFFDVSSVGNPKSTAEAFLNKTHAGEVAVAMEYIANALKRDLTTENLFNLAASQSFGAGISKAQLETRMKMQKAMGKKLGEEFSSIEMDNSKKLWTSCFYLVLK